MAQMKINMFLLLVSIALTALLGYWIYDTARGDENDILCGIISSVCILSTLIPFIGLQYEDTRIGVNIRILSCLFLVIFLVSHFCFAIFGVAMPAYLIVNGSALLIYLAIFYKLQGIRKS